MCLCANKIVKLKQLCVCIVYSQRGYAHPLGDTKCFVTIWDILTDIAEIFNDIIQYQQNQLKPA